MKDDAELHRMAKEASANVLLMRKGLTFALVTLVGSALLGSVGPAAAGTLVDGVDALAKSSPTDDPGDKISDAVNEACASVEAGPKRGKCFQDELNKQLDALPRDGRYRVDDPGNNDTSYIQPSFAEVAMFVVMGVDGQKMSNGTVKVGRFFGREDPTQPCLLIVNDGSGQRYIDFHKLTGEYQIQPIAGINLMYNVTLYGRKALCYSRNPYSCTDNIISHPPSLNHPTRIVRALQYIIENFCAPEVAPTQRPY